MGAKMIKCSTGGGTDQYVWISVRRIVTVTPTLGGWCAISLSTGQVWKVEETAVAVISMMEQANEDCVGA